MTAPTSDLCIFAGTFVKTWKVPFAGTLIEQHRHAHPHVTLLAQGRIRVFCDGAELGVFEAPAMIKITANAAHYFVSLTDGVLLACIHAVTEAEKE